MHPDSPSESQSAAPARASAGLRPRISSNDIDDPLRDNDDLLDRLALERTADRVESEHRFFDGRLACIAGDDKIGPLAAVDLNRQCDHTLRDELFIGHWPRGLCGERLVAEERPARF